MHSYFRNANTEKKYINLTAELPRFGTNTYKNWDRIVTECFVCQINVVMVCCPNQDIMSYPSFCCRSWTFLPRIECSLPSLISLTNDLNVKTGWRISHVTDKELIYLYAVLYQHCAVSSSSDNVCYVKWMVRINRFIKCITNMMKWSVKSNCQYTAKKLRFDRRTISCECVAVSLESCGGRWVIYLCWARQRIQRGNRAV